jgi:hypothetical protein
MSAAPALASGQSTGDGFMWIERRLPRLRQYRALGLASAAARHLAPLRQLTEHAIHDPGQLLE